MDNKTWEKMFSSEGISILISPDVYINVELQFMHHLSCSYPNTLHCLAISKNSAD